MSTSRPRVLVTHPEVPQDAIDLLSEKCDVIIIQSVPPKRSEILEKCVGVDALYWTNNEVLNAEILDKVGPQLKCISTMSANLSHVDVPEVKKRGIPLGHSMKTVLNDAVADLAVGLMIAAARRFHEGRLQIESSKWTLSHIKWMWGQEIRDSTVGFFGFGGIGQTIAKRLTGFHIRVILYTTRNRVSKEIEEKYNARHANFDKMLRSSDIIFIAATLTPETQGVFNAAAFEKMKLTAVLVNVARGPIISQGDLYKALKEEKIFAAGLDVMVPEPLPADDPLMSLPNCVILPHIGGATERTRTDLAVVAAHNILRGLAGEPMLSPAY